MKQLSPVPSTSDIKASNGDSSDRDTKKTNCNCALLADCFLFFNFIDAIKEGDGLRLMRHYKNIMLYCKADDPHSTKYSLESLYQFFLVCCLLSPRGSERFIWNRFVKNHGKKGTNIPLDEAREHSNSS